ncbi:MAG: hypothetical protein GXO82_08180 [Chlorobi bacterium]|nr:hypothetical protein [Chlorobiota bacterium]
MMRKTKLSRITVWFLVGGTFATFIFNGCIQVPLRYYDYPPVVFVNLGADEDLEVVGTNVDDFRKDLSTWYLTVSDQLPRDRRRDWLSNLGLRVYLYAAPVSRSALLGVLGAPAGSVGQDSTVVFVVFTTEVIDILSPDQEIQDVRQSWKVFATPELARREFKTFAKGFIRQVMKDF